MIVCRYTKLKMELLIAAMPTSSSSSLLLLLLLLLLLDTLKNCRDKFSRLSIDLHHSKILAVVRSFPSQTFVYQS